MKRFVVFLGIVFFSASLSAASSRYLGELASGAPTFNSPACSTATPYLVVGAIRPGVSGDYFFRDVSQDYESGSGLEMEVDVYAGSFDPDLPANNYLDSVWGAEPLLGMDSGTDYFFVVHSGSCDPEFAPFDFVLVGPGTWSGSLPDAETEDFEVHFTEDLPTFDANACTREDPSGNPRAYLTFNFVPPRTGLYSYEDIDGQMGYVDLNIDIYQGSFDPNSPTTNVINPEYDDDTDTSAVFLLQGGVQHVAVAFGYCGDDNPVTGTGRFLVIAHPGAADAAPPFALPFLPISVVPVPVLSPIGLLLMLGGLVAVAFGWGFRHRGSG